MIFRLSSETQQVFFPHLTISWWTSYPGYVFGSCLDHCHPSQWSIAQSWENPLQWLNEFQRLREVMGRYIWDLRYAYLNELEIVVWSFPIWVVVISWMDDICWIYLLVWWLLLGGVRPKIWNPMDPGRQMWWQSPVATSPFAAALRFISWPSEISPGSEIHRSITPS